MTTFSKSIYGPRILGTTVPLKSINHAVPYHRKRKGHANLAGMEVWFLGHGDVTRALGG